MTGKPDDLELLDSDGYPTDETLEKLRGFQITESAAALDFIARAWHWQDFGVSHELRPHEAEIVHAEPGDRFLRLATGGWSGNEDMLDAFEESLAYFLSWRLSASGGLHIFQYPTTPEEP